MDGLNFCFLSSYQRHTENNEKPSRSTHSLKHVERKTGHSIETAIPLLLSIPPSKTYCRAPSGLPYVITYSPPALPAYLAVPLGANTIIAASGSLRRSQRRRAVDFDKWNSSVTYAYTFHSPVVTSTGFPALICCKLKICKATSMLN